MEQKLQRSITKKYSRPSSTPCLGGVTTLVTISPRSESRSPAAFNYRDLCVQRGTVDPGSIYFVRSFREGNYAWISKLALACTPHCRNPIGDLYLPLVSFCSYTMSTVCLRIHRQALSHTAVDTCHFDLTHTRACTWTRTDAHDIARKSYYYFYVTACFLFNVCAALATRNPRLLNYRYQVSMIIHQSMYRARFICRLMSSRM